MTKANATDYKLRDQCNYKYVKYKLLRKICMSEYTCKKTNEKAWIGQANSEN